MKQKINVFDYAGQICTAMKKGILLTTAENGHVNTMTIGWGKLGIEWGLPVFIAYVRESRYTMEVLEKNGEFTVNIPQESLDPRILGYCGTKSGRDTDKIADLGLTLEKGEQISVPGIRELPITLECRVIYKQKQDPELLSQNLLDRYYPVEENGSRDAHIAYYGQILDAYVITE